MTVIYGSLDIYIYIYIALFTQLRHIFTDIRSQARGADQEGGTAPHFSGPPGARHSAACAGGFARWWKVGQEKDQRDGVNAGPYNRRGENTCCLIKMNRYRSRKKR